MGVYLIDFENTREAGLKGVEGLDKNDILYIFTSREARKMSMETREKIEQSGAYIDVHIICKTAKNYLDFQLVTYLGFLIDREKAQGDFQIISEDQGYDAVVDFWDSGEISKRKISVRRDDNIAQSFFSDHGNIARCADGNAAAKARKKKKRKRTKIVIFPEKPELHNSLIDLDLNQQQLYLIDCAFVFAGKEKGYLNSLKRSLGKRMGKQVFDTTINVFLKNKVLNKSNLTNNTSESC